MERPKNTPEQENLLLEEILWQKILDSEKARSLLERNDPQISLLGSDRDPTLACQIRNSHCGARITVFENESQLDPKNVEPQDLVIAHCLIHKTNPEDLVKKAKAVLKQRGLFFATTSGLGSIRTSLRLEVAGVSYTKEELKSGFLCPSKNSPKKNAA